MFITVESGATKTAWRAVYEDGSVRSVQTAGLSPTCLDSDHTQEIVRKAIPELNPEGRLVDEIFFYGAGLVSQESWAPLEETLQIWCPMATTHFYSDILAAARALFGDGSGVVAIMGTGSNSCLYENGEIVRNIRPGGYILGDEGSGVSLGRAFLADLVKGLVPRTIEKAFQKEFGLDYSQIVMKVYKEQAASAFMASLAPFILTHKEDPYISDLIEDCLESFIKRALARYVSEASDKDAARKIGVVGSFGSACGEKLRETGHRHGLEFVKFIKSPIDELVTYHRTRHGI
jgi:N-acetylglucosamine kinase-like BadF-type ATPase